MCAFVYCVYMAMHMYIEYDYRWVIEYFEGVALQEHDFRQAMFFCVA